MASALHIMRLEYPLFACAKLGTHAEARCFVALQTDASSNLRTGPAQRGTARRKNVQHINTPHHRAADATGARWCVHILSCNSSTTKQDACYPRTCVKHLCALLCALLRACPPILHRDPSLMALPMMQVCCYSETRPVSCNVRTCKLCTAQGAQPPAWWTAPLPRTHRLTAGHFLRLAGEAAATTALVAAGIAQASTAAAQAAHLAATLAAAAAQVALA